MRCSSVDSATTVPGLTAVDHYGAVKLSGPCVGTCGVPLNHPPRLPCSASSLIHGAVVTSVGGTSLQEAVGDGIGIDSVSPGLAGELGGFTEGFECVEGFTASVSGVVGVPGPDVVTDGVGGAVTDAGEQVSGLGDFLGR